MLSHIYRESQESVQAVQPDDNNSNAGQIFLQHSCYIISEHWIVSNNFFYLHADYCPHPCCQKCCDNNKDGDNSPHTNNHNSSSQNFREKSEIEIN